MDFIPGNNTKKLLPEPIPLLKVPTQMLTGETKWEAHHYHLNTLSPTL